MPLSRRVPALALLVSLAIPVTRARAQGEARPADTPVSVPAPLTAPPRKIEWRDVVWGDRQGRMLHAEKPFQDGRLLEGEPLYLAVGRPDLAQAYRSREQGRTGLQVVGAILVAGGGVTALAIGAPHQNDGTTPAIAAGVSVILGAVLLLAASVDSPIVTDSELHRLVDAHNDAR